ncbi:MAG: hypothetical protein JW809_11295 [Pirellulales bacterium]|nr:hypothetical protein [Pirellulales bacterium]
MTTQYRLPCPCGSFVLVDPRQAGQTVRCECGRTLDVPTMRAIGELEPVVLAQDAARHPLVWGVRQRVLLAGWVLVLASVGTLLYFWLLTKPESPARFFAPERIQRGTERLTLVETFMLWERLQQEALARQHPDLAEYAKALLAYRIRMGVTSVFLAIGVLTLLGALFIPKPSAPSDSGRGENPPRDRDDDSGA